MKFETILASVLLAGLTSTGTSTGKHDLEIDIANIKNTKGTVAVGIYNSEHGFLTKGKEFKTKTIKVSGSTVHCEFTDLPDGKYAVAVFHDENSDKKFNTNMLGLPKEAYGFSNNFKPVISKPKFSDTEFTLNSDKKITIKLIH
ncbi:DUF2141 domain-containing protein [Halpernia frigidisoli]|uniref:Uncharacterized conserved protein, DUF2141 family n=1 Tax=Halpernia frigidisoli TaxID=1125876 RepID=A0A1I3DWB9_9FLAO|nr:DUF2141 domain-containing protein [Halpernia frigidisoli]SFH90751.1 Uncharacterized conserved protein, DUF2141 family [Halpernia frigidisoli]